MNWRAFWAMLGIFAAVSVIAFVLVAVGAYLEPRVGDPWAAVIIGSFVFVSAATVVGLIEGRYR